MTGLLAGIAAICVPLVLLASVYGQVRRPGALAAALRAHRVFPRGFAGALAVCVIAAEALAGAGGAVALLFWLDGPMRAASAASAVLLASYALYGTYVSRARQGVPCGCAGDGTPMTGWVAGRAAALAAAALIGALHGLPSGPAAYEMFITAAAGPGFAVILWALPRALLTERRTAG